MKIKVINKSQNSLPSYGTNGAAAFDLRADEQKLIFPGETQLVGTNLFFEIPDGYALFIFSRSGLAAKGIVVGNGVGVVDSDYRGEVKVILRNENIPSGKKVEDNSFKINIGDRIAQGIILPIVQYEFESVENLSSTDRGEGGFGSTGVK